MTTWVASGATGLSYWDVSFSWDVESWDGGPALWAGSPLPVSTYIASSSTGTSWVVST